MTVTTPASKIDWSTAIDCDIHPRVPDIDALAKYMDDYWREAVAVRGISDWDSIGLPGNAPFTIREDWRQGADGRRADEDVGRMKAAVLDRFGFRHAICNCLYGVQMIRDENMAAAFAKAVNDWLAAEWLAKDARLRGSIVLPIQNTDLAVAEIERRASDMRFVQVLVLAMGEFPLGKSRYWPIWEACERHGLAVGVHAGSSYHHAVTGSGWPSYAVEDYAAQALGFQTQVGSFVAEGVFVKYPKLKVVLLESGVTWLPAYLWRLSKFWRGVRLEVPWIDRSPFEMVRDNLRLTMQPFDGPTDAASVARVIDMMPSPDMLLFASDFPHWQYDGEQMLPAGIPDKLVAKILADNALATYPRLARLS